AKMNGNVVLFLTQMVVARAMLNPIDFLALQSIRKGLNDVPGSVFFSTWDFTSDPCAGFAGVYCDGGQRVSALHLGDSRAGSPGLMGRIDPAVGKLSALVELTVVPGRVMGRLPYTLSELKNLRFLGISRNYISGEIPPGLGLLRGLRTIDLSFNQLTGSIPVSIGALPALSNLILSHNRLTGGIPRFSSPRLTRLDVKHNQLSGWLSSKGLPPSIRYLSVSANRLWGPVDRALSGLNQASYVDLSMNRFSGEIPGVLFTFPIVSLQLQRNQFIGKILPATDRVKIPVVDLSFNRLWGEISPAFSTVQILYLNDNRLTGEVPGSLVDGIVSGNIHVLYLQHNFLTGMGINPTARIPPTTSLCLQYNCMVLPVDTPCPPRAGKQKARPTQQCPRWKG
ncbi:hypothetical protein M569_10937, partial [Genlisea aurea]